MIASLILFVFAAFDCVSGAHTHAAGGVRSKEPAVRNLLSQLQTLRAEYPQLLVLAYNTFTVDAAVIAQLDETDSRAVVSAMWCLYLDYIYCGDPRPAEQIPAGLPQSLLAYTDAMEQRFLRAFVPPEAIDDHGTMIGNTTTSNLLSGQVRFPRQLDYEFVARKPQAKPLRRTLASG